MLCDICKKNEATIHYKEFVGGTQKSLNVCAECAQKHDKTSGLNFSAFNLAEMLCNFGNLVKNDSPAGKEDSGKSCVCPRCGRSLHDLRESGGRLGCAECYKVFAPVLDEVIGRVQRGKIHTGKRPGRHRSCGAERSARLIRLKKELADLIKTENYEQAAVVRDEIRKLENHAPSRKTAGKEEA